MPSFVRNLALRFYREHFPFSRKSATFPSMPPMNSPPPSSLIPASRAVVPSYDLNWKQMAAPQRRLGPAGVQNLEMVIHQHMPMFHMEHCVFAHTLSTGKDYHDCGRPCENHTRSIPADRVGEPHPLILDVGLPECTLLQRPGPDRRPNTSRKFCRPGVRHFRVELLREAGPKAAEQVSQYAAVLSGKSEVMTTVRSLRVLNQLGVTRGTPDRE